MTGTVRYCYAVTRGLPDDVLSGASGVSAAPVEPVRAGGLVAVTSPVDADEFSTDSLRKSLEDLDWLGEVARAHNAVVDLVARHTVTLPLRLATIYHDVERVGAVLDSESTRWAAALDRLQGHVEWGIKVFAPERAESEPEQQQRPATGRSFLQQRLAQRDSRETNLRAASDSAEKIDAGLSAIAREQHRHRVQAQELSGVTGPNVLNAAYLVDTEEQDGFLRRVDELRQRHADCRIDVTGPWAPYSFALDQAAPASDAG